MPPKQLVYALVTFLHDLFTAMWIGGLLTMGLVLIPAGRTVLGPGGGLQKLLRAQQKRLSVLVYVSMIGLILTGVLLGRRVPAYGGPFGFGTPYATVLSLKHVLVAAMIVIALARSLFLTRRQTPNRVRATGNASRASAKGAASGPAAAQKKPYLIYVNMVLGVLVLLLSGLSAALGSGPPPQ